MNYKHVILLTLALVAMIALVACAEQAASPTTPPTSASASSSQAVSPQSAPATGLQVQIVPPTPSCSGALEPTLSMTEGPYYKQNPPERLNLMEDGMAGTKLVITGYVLSTSCKGIAQARVDFWQADGDGKYDNSGYKMRGFQITDEAGRYHLETVVPGLYPGRTRHIHVKVQAPNQPELTTQLFFPNEAQNQRDSIFSPKLVVTLADSNVGKVATFNFVLNIK